jgi:hypothetical protein
MKKTILSLLFAMTILISYSQKNVEYRVGLVTPLPVNVTQLTKVDVGSSMFEVDYKFSKQIKTTLSSGFLRFNSMQDFYGVPLLAGAKCYTSNTTNNSMYFGANAGCFWFNKEYPVSNRLMWSSYIGFEQGHVSVNIQYINWYKLNNSNNNLSIFVAYKLN